MSQELFSISSYMITHGNLYMWNTGFTLYYYLLLFITTHKEMVVFFSFFFFNKTSVWLDKSRNKTNSENESTEKNLNNSIWSSNKINTAERIGEEDVAEWLFIFHLKIKPSMVKMFTVFSMKDKLTRCVTWIQTSAEAISLFLHYSHDWNV